MKLKGEEIEKIYYSIGEVAAMLNCATSRIRFWCDEFAISPKRVRINCRSFNKEEVAKLKIIANLLDVEMYTVKGAKVQYVQRLKN